MLEKLRTDFIGLDTEYTLANGKKTRRIYLDSTASTLMLGAAHEALEAFYRHYANTHSLLHFPAMIATSEYAWAHDRVLSFLGADPERYACFFTGSGATAGINRMARVFNSYRSNRGVVLVSLMEHHSNDLPHRKHAGKVVHLPLTTHPDGQPGCICLQGLEKTLGEMGDRVNYIAVTGVSNVTGIINPVHDIARLAHRVGALILVDGAQSAAHIPVTMSGHDDPNADLDAFVFSGHKTYVPGSPGVVVCRKDILQAIEPDEVGGGMVDRVFVDRYIVSERFPDREEAGTPNIPGAIALAATLEVFDRIGMDVIHDDETELINFALEKIRAIPEVIVYGESDPDLCPRAASVSFNVSGMDHGLVAAILNDYYNISVRNECFCAHPYVKEMVMDDLLEAADDIDDAEFEKAILLKSGMVRASFGLYNTREDVEALADALGEIIELRDFYRSHYDPADAGMYVHKSFKLAESEHFRVSKFLDGYFR